MDIMRIGSCELPYPDMMPTKRKEARLIVPKETGVLLAQFIFPTVAAE